MYDSAYRKTRKITAYCTQMKQLVRIYVTDKQFRHKQSQKGAKFTHKIHKNCDYNQTLDACAMMH